MVVVGDVLKGFDVLIQIAAQRNIHQLDAPADGQHRLVGGKEGAQQQRLGGIPQNVGLASCTAFSGSSSSIQRISAPARARLSGYFAWASASSWFGTMRGIAIVIDIDFPFLSYRSL